jgi:2-polyprenyl-6-methoxyphenol hydroxylase-like FAD-dependent oxidoreductase
MNTPIVICGTGIVGLAAALGFARRGERVTILGPKRSFDPALAEVFDARVYAISPASQCYLAALGVWDLLDVRRITPVEAMEILGDADGFI